MFKACIRHVVIFSLISCSVFARADDSSMFIAGKDYVKLDSKVRNNIDVQQLIISDPSKVQVVIFFSYACHVCDILDSRFDQWEAKETNKKVKVYHFPVSFNKQWGMLAKMYYVMEYLDPKHSLDNKIFSAVHKDGTRLWQEPVMKKFFVDNGYTEQEFDLAFDSFSVNRHTKRADELSKAYGIIETPTVVVNGPRASYLLNVVKAGGDVDRFFKVLDYVINRELKILQSGQ